MSNQLRHKGKFMKKNVLARKIKAVAASLEARKRDKEESDKENLEVIQCDGRRIVEVKELAKNLRCCKCQKVLSLERIVKEKRLGLNSCFIVSCETCCVNTSVCTGKIHTSKDNAKLSDINTKAVLGAIHAGIGSTAVNKLLACLNIPPLTENLFKRHEREIGPAIQECDKESCRRAAEEERRLVIENVEKLCQEIDGHEKIRSGRAGIRNIREWLKIHNSVSLARIALKIGHNILKKLWMHIKHKYEERPDQVDNLASRSKTFVKELTNEQNESERTVKSVQGIPQRKNKIEESKTR